MAIPKLPVVIISQHIHISDPYVVHLKRGQCCTPIISQLKTGSGPFRFSLLLWDWLSSWSTVRCVAWRPLGTSRFCYCPRQFPWVLMSEKYSHTGKCQLSMCADPGKAPFLTGLLLGCPQASGNAALGASGGCPAAPDLPQGADQLTFPSLCS